VRRFNALVAQSEGAPRRALHRRWPVERSEGWSLLLGTEDSGQLSYRGLVHFGVGRQLADALARNGLVRSTSPFSERIPLRGVPWLDPRLVGEVSYAEAISGGGLRAPVFSGFATRSSSG